MIKSFINSIKLSRISYLLETIRVRDFRSKIKAFNKLKQMKITKDAGLLILDESNFKVDSAFGNFNIGISLLSLLFADYYDEYSDHIFYLYPSMTLDTKYEILNLLANCNKKSAVLLYKKLLVKYGNELDNIPIGTLSTNKNNYDYLFPDILKVLKYDIKRNNLLLLLNDFFNLGIVKENDIKKYRRNIQTNIVSIFDEALNYKLSSKDNFMQNNDYINLRIFLEAAVSIEFYVSNKQTKDRLEKLLKKKDNQLKLFILENYLRKGKDISKVNLNSIAKDVLSRYPLYSFLKFYNLEKLMPEKYANNKLLSESDLIINYCIEYKYESIPNNVELLEEKTIDKYKYYIYKFETKYNYHEEVKDPATDYILKTTEIDKKLIDNTIVKYIGISGGFNKDLDPSLIENNLNELKVVKYVDDYEDIVNGMISNNITDENVKVEKKKHKVKKDKVKKEKTKKDKRVKVKKEKKEKIFKEEIYVEDDNPSLLRRIFSFNTLLVIMTLALVSAVVLLSTYLNGMDLLDLKNTSNDYNNIKTIKSVAIKNDKYKEISYKDIFKQDKKEYYVMLYNKKEKSIYHGYIDTLINNDYTFYYVDLSKEENKAIYSGNETGFIISDEVLLKVKEGEYEFFVIKKINIIREIKDYVDSINRKKEEEAKKKALEEKEKKEKEKKEREKITSKNVSRVKINLDFTSPKYYNVF